MLVRDHYDFWIVWFKMSSMVLDKSKKYTHDSREINIGDSFICLPKGEAYIEDALNRGATDVVHMNREEFALNANEYFDDPTKRVCLIGVTGTNGKTSVCYFTAQILEALGANVLVIGTINSKLTTPESWDILSKIKDHLDNGGTHVVMEVSSHGIDQKRVFGFDFDVKCLTNITHDHLDYHKTFENYKNTKMDFMFNYPGQAIYSEDISTIVPEDIPQLAGSFHLKNATAAIEICKRVGKTLNEIQPILKNLKAPPGRFESISLGQPFKVIIDFAHTPDALAMVLKDALKLVSGKKEKLRVVFGCGGDRDKAKRSKMGAIADQYSHAIYLTADNSRSESTLDIINDIKDGVKSQEAVQSIALDRQEAISSAIKAAALGDVIVIAGKGHETMQVTKNFSYYFNDTEIATYEIMKQKRFQSNQTWVLNEPDANADVLFISKKLMHQLKITYSQFRRSIPTPSLAKVKDYFSKINGEKIVVMESSNRFSVYELLSSLLLHCGGAHLYEFGSQDELEHDLVGLTLIEQTELPIVIKINPQKFQNLNRIIDIISPNHIVIGEVYHQNEYIEPGVQKTILSLFEEGRIKFSFWCSDQMSDLCDPLQEISDSQCHFIKSTSWLDYELELAKELLIKLEMYHDDPNVLFQQYLRSSQWYFKLNILANNFHAYTVHWQNDRLDLKQKIAYFQQNSEPLIHHVIPSPSSDIICKEIKQISHTDQPVMHHTQDSFRLYIGELEKNNPAAIHIIWLDQSQALSTLEAML